MGSIPITRSIDPRVVSMVALDESAKNQSAGVDGLVHASHDRVGGRPAAIDGGRHAAVPRDMGWESTLWRDQALSPSRAVGAGSSCRKRTFNGGYDPLQTSHGLYVLANVYALSAALHDAGSAVGCMRCWAGRQVTGEHRQDTSLAARLVLQPPTGRA